MVSTVSTVEAPGATPGTVNLPAPTAWPIHSCIRHHSTLAGLLTSASVSILGAILAVTGCVGLVPRCPPTEKEETVEVKAEVTVVSTLRREVERLPIAPDLPRALLPLETYPVSAGIKGGWQAAWPWRYSHAFTVFLKQRSIWYPINLLAATASAQSFHFCMTSLNTFHLSSFFPGGRHSSAHLLLVGLLYGAMLPMFPRRPILLGGVIAPILWTGLLRSI